VVRFAAIVETSVVTKELAFGKSVLHCTQLNHRCTAMWVSPSEAVPSMCERILDELRGVLSDIHGLQA
jgi:hypothetical protein